MAEPRLYEIAHCSYWNATRKHNAGSKPRLCRNVAVGRLCDHPVAEPVGVAFAAPRQLDGFCRDGFPRAVRGVGHTEGSAYSVERDRHGAGGLGPEH
jgi:hypothetical protein